METIVDIIKLLFALFVLFWVAVAILGFFRLGESVGNRLDDYNDRNRRD